MIRKVIAILKKHLDEAYEDSDQWEALEYSPFDVLQGHPDFHQLRRLAHELIGVILGTDVSKLVAVPKQKEAFDFVKSIYPVGWEVDDEYIAYCAKELRIWLAGYRHWSECTHPKVILRTGDDDKYR